jgi:EF hand
VWLLVAAHGVIRLVDSTSGLYAFSLCVLRLVHRLVEVLLSRCVFMDLHGSFARFDENGDGSISREELKQVCTAFLDESVQWER